MIGVRRSLSEMSLSRSTFEPYPPTRDPRLPRNSHKALMAGPRRQEKAQEHACLFARSADPQFESVDSLGPSCHPCRTLELAKHATCKSSVSTCDFLADLPTSVLLSLLESVHFTLSCTDSSIHLNLFPIEFVTRTIQAQSLPLPVAIALLESFPLSTPSTLQT